MKKLLTVIVMVLVIVGVSVVGSVAGVNTIKPDQLIPIITTSSYIQDASKVRSNSSSPAVQYYFNVKLLVGKTVKKLTSYHEGYGSPLTQVVLLRTKMGEHDQIMALKASADSSGEILLLEDPAVEFAKI